VRLLAQQVAVARAQQWPAPQPQLMWHPCLYCLPACLYCLPACTACLPACLPACTACLPACLPVLLACLPPAWAALPACLPACTACLPACSWLCGFRHHAGCDACAGAARRYPNYSKAAFNALEKVGLDEGGCHAAGGTPGFTIAKLLHPIGCCRCCPAPAVLPAALPAEQHNHHGGPLYRAKL
jgi:hypothetical protein